MHPQADQTCSLDDSCVTRGGIGRCRDGAVYATVAIAGLLALSWIPGCGGGEDASVEPLTESPESHRATAEALFEHVQSLCNLEYPDAESYYALVYAENAAQRSWMQFVADHSVPTYRFAKACLDRYGTLPLMRMHGVWEIADHTWQSVDADRALIECFNRNGVESPLHLVRLGDTWWISGYTFERGNIGFDHPDFETFVGRMRGHGPYIEAVTARVRNGELATLEDAEAARSAAVSAWGRTRPDPE